MNSERNLDIVIKAELINLVEKLQNKARKLKIAIQSDILQHSQIDQKETDG